MSPGRGEGDLAWCRLKPPDEPADLVEMERTVSRWVRERLWHAVGRDGHSETSTDESRQLELCRYMWWVRHATLGMALVLALRGGLTERSEYLTLLLFVLQIAGHVWSRAVPAQAGLVAVLDGLAFLVLAVLGLAPGLVLLVAVAMLGWAATFRPLPAATTYLAVLAAEGAMLHRHGTPDPDTAVLAFSLLGGVFMLRTIRLNISARQAAERDRLVSECIDAIIWEEIPGTDTITVSPAARRILGHPSSAWSTPGFWRTAVHPADLPGWMSIGTRRTQPPDHPLRMRHADGSWRWMESQTSVVTDRHGRPAFAVGVLLDRTERMEAGRQLRRQARRDDLTRLPNRRALLETIEARLKEDTGEPTALLVLDLDGFKDINDSLGHRTGDELLRRVGRLIVAGLGPGETAARLGGDEFAVMAPRLDAVAAAARARVLAETLQAPVEVDDLRLRVRISVGFAVHPTDAADAADLIRHADVAMYQAKNLGTNEQHYDAANDGFSSERVTLTADLYSAIPDGQLRLHHQPLVAVVTGEAVGTEALVRWQHPKLGLIPPGRFTELAEASGQVKPLTRWVIHRALEDLHGLGPAGAGLEVSVNLSVRNLYETDFLAWLRNTLRDVGVPGERLVVEITESTAMLDHTAAIRMIEGMRELGVRTWIDDFGTGYSSLARLRTLPVDGVKIDRSFVTGASASAKDRAVLGSLIDLVGSFGLQTIAEGVEHQGCLDILRELGCDLAQGFHFARPMPSHALAQYLDGSRPTGAALDAPHPIEPGPIVPRPGGPPVRVHRPGLDTSLPGLRPQ